MPVRAAIALGSNLGDRRAILLAALTAIEALPGTRVVAVSTFVDTAPVGPIPQPHFLNAAAMVETSLGARELLNALLQIEHAHGRNRASVPIRGPRTLDLDLLLYGDAVIDEPGLTVPHPRMHERSFVLGPLAEIAPELVVPTLRQTAAALHDRLGAPARPSPYL